MSTEHPILMAGPLVRAVLEGRKSVTRRLIRGLGNARHIDRLLGDWGLSEDPEPYTGVERPWRPTRTPRLGDWLWTVQSDVDDTICEVLRCPFGALGDTLWVREMWRLDAYDSPPDAHQWCVRFADGATQAIPADVPTDTVVRWASKTGWQPSIHMPRWAARLFLRVESVTVERVQDITEEDSQREGVVDAYDGGRPVFAMVWDSLAPAGSKWADNPWVWRVGFTRIEVSR